MAKLIELTCPGCSKALTASTAETTIRCIHCGNLIPLTQTPEPVSGAKKDPVPSGVQVKADQDSLRISYNWFNLVYLIMFILGVRFPFLIANWILDGRWPLWSVIFLLILIAVLGWVVVHLINRTVIEITATEIAVWFEPIPWFGERNIQQSELKELICTKSMSMNFRGSESAKLYEHHIYAFLKGSPREIRLLPNLPSSKAALFVKQLIDEWRGSRGWG